MAEDGEDWNGLKETILKSSAIFFQNTRTMTYLLRLRLQVPVTGIVTGEGAVFLELETLEKQKIYDWTA